MVRVPWQQGQVTSKAVGFAGWAIQKIVLHAESTRERNLYSSKLSKVPPLVVQDFGVRQMNTRFEE